MVKSIRNESGQSMVLVALMLVVLLGFGALAVDIGYMTFQRSKLQNAADSAALSGAVLLPNKTNVDVNKSAVRYSVENIYKDTIPTTTSTQTDKTLTLKTADADTTVFSEVDRKDGTVTIKIEQVVPKFLGGIFSDEPETMHVMAKAKTLGKWAGQGMPFVNMETYTVGEVINSIWDKTYPGDKEKLLCTATDKNGPAETTFITVNYEDGLPLDKGKVANIKTQVENMINNHEYIYLFSLSKEVLDTKLCPVVTSKGESVIRDLSGNGKFMPGDIIPLSSVVLLKINNLGYEKMIIDGTVVAEYPFNETTGKFDVPDDYSGAGAIEVTSNLIQ